MSCLIREFLFFLRAKNFFTVFSLDMRITCAAFHAENLYKNNQYNIGKKSYYNRIVPDIRVCPDTFIKEPSFQGKNLQ